MVERDGRVGGIGFALGDYLVEGQFAMRFPVVFSVDCSRSFYLFSGALSVIKKEAGASFFVYS